MKRTRLITLLAGFAIVAMLSQDAFARNRMYNPAVGRFMQRDPAGTMMVPPPAKARSLSGSQYTRRDPTGQYADGMNLYQYVRSSPVIYLDWTGLEASTESASKPKPNYGLVVPDAAFRASLIQLMGKMCPCFDYKDGGNDSPRISIADKFKADNDGKPSREFCCCYYRNMPGCNLLIAYRDQGGKAPFPVGRDFTVKEAIAFR